MSAKPRIPVTSTAGRTGAAAVNELLAQGFPVRAFVRREDARSGELRQAGAEIFTGDPARGHLGGRTRRPGWHERFVGDPLQGGGGRSPEGGLPW